MTDELWYLGRGTGVVSLVLFTLVMALGMVVRVGAALPGLPRFAVSAIHRTTSLTALGFLLVHIVTLLLDPYAQLRLLDTVLPFLATYRPVWQGLGTLAFDLVVVLVVTSLLRHRLGLRTWRAVHWSAYACWPLAVAHGVGIGTDGTSWWMLTVAAACVALVGSTLTWSLLRRSRDAAPEPVAAPAGLAGLR